MPFLFSTGLWAFLLKYCISAGNYAFTDDIPEGAFDEVVQAVRQAKAMIAFNSMRRKAAKAGFLLLNVRPDRKNFCILVKIALKMKREIF